MEIKEGQMIIKYQAERTFKDMYTKEIIPKDTVLNIDLKRMKELNKKKFGRVIDIIFVEADAAENQNETMKDNENKDEEEKTEQTDKTENVEENTEKYTKEQLENMTVNQLKDLAEEIKCELTKAKKEEIIEELLKFQEK